MVVIVQLVAPEGKVKRIHCYVYDSPLGSTEKILILSLQSVSDRSIHQHHPLHEHVHQGPVRSSHVLAGQQVP
jgi:hypothetical protein